MLAQILARRPRGRALELALGFERILAGRAVVRSLDLGLVCTREGDPASASWRVALHARGASATPVELEAGPASLRTERTVVDRAGNERRAVEYRSFPELGSLLVEAGEPCEVEIAREAVLLPRGAIAARHTYELELRSGVARVGGRELPAMRLHVDSGEALELAPAIDRSASTADELVALAWQGGGGAHEALALAVRLPASDRARSLDLLGARARELSEISLRRMVPALRWISGASEPGGSPEAWRAWLVARSERRAAHTERPKLMLPSAPARP